MEGEVVGIQEGTEMAEVALERPRVGRTNRPLEEMAGQERESENVWKTTGGSTEHFYLPNW
jgi:hypothetical protein